MQKITPCLWFATQAEEAAKYYTSIFPNSRIVAISHYGEGMPLPAGTVLTVMFELDGQEFMGLNGGSKSGFSEAISFTVNCESQEELDAYWSKLSAGGAEVQCGWLKDKYGVSWQITPTVVHRMLQSKDAAKRQRMLDALRPMVKIDIATLQRAFEG